MKRQNTLLIDAADMTSTIESAWYSVDEFNHGGIHCWWSDTPTGTLSLQYSNESPSDSSLVVNPATVSGSAQAIAGAAGTHYWDIEVLNAVWVRVVYTASSGSGTLNARTNVKASGH